MKSRSKVRVSGLAALAASLFVATAASANGRFPRAEHLLEDPTDQSRLTVAATYGILTTDNGGASWYYTCEQAFSLIPSPPGYLGDPELALLPSGALLAGVQSRLTMSEDRACGWKAVLEAPKMFIGDFAVAPSNRNIVVALTRTLMAGGGAQIQLQHSTDGGRTWRVVGTPLPIALDYTVDVDPKNPDHVYATGITSTAGNDTGVLLSSTDLGVTWVTHAIPKTSIEAGPYIARVHTSDPAKIFVRTDEWTDNTANMAANDALLYTDDGGTTWTELLRPRGPDGGAKLFGFALSPDGSTALAGFGDPVEGGGRIVDRTVMGVYKSSGARYAFGTTPVPLLVESVSCLEWTTKGVYICGAPDGKVSYVGFVNDVEHMSTAGLSTIMRANEVRGEPPCCRGSAASMCNWPDDCQRLGACADGGPDDGHPSCANDAGADSGQNRGGTGGSAGTGGTAGTGGATAGNGSTAGGSSTSCQCNLSTNRGSFGACALALVSLVLAARRRSSGARNPLRRKRDNYHVNAEDQAAHLP